MSAAIENNRLLEGLPQKEHKRILEHCEPVDLDLGTVLYEADRPFRDVYFPLTGYVSLTYTVGIHRPLGMALIGNEGVLGASLVLGPDITPMSAVAQAAGRALKLSVPELQQELRSSPVLNRTLNRYLYVLLSALSQNAACLHFHLIQARLARWLLMANDRTREEYLYLTHQMLADMLGVQRSAVTITAGDLQKRKLISYARGTIRILDRKGMEEMSCECYEAVNDDYVQLFS